MYKKIMSAFVNNVFMNKYIFHIIILTSKAQLLLNFFQEFNFLFDGRLIRSFFRNMVWYYYLLA